MHSEFLTLDVRDWLKGLLMAVLSAVLMVVIELLKTNHPIDWAAVGITAMIAALSYILKQLGTDGNGMVLGKL